MSLTVGQRKILERRLHEERDRALSLLNRGLAERAGASEQDRAGDLTLLPKVLDAASRFEQRPSDDKMAEMAGAMRMTSLFGLPA